jgi:solute carrier family 25 folate transporter 32
MVKTRLQGKFDVPPQLESWELNYLVDRSSSSRLGSSLRIIREIFYHEGGLVAFYRGLTPNVIGNSTSWGLYFLCYGSLKDTIRAYRDKKGQILSSSDYFIASGGAGMPS